MKDKPIAELSNEALIKYTKSLKAVTYMLAAALIVLFVVNVLLAIKKGFNALSVVPIALLPILIINLSTLKKATAELKSRNL